MFGGLEIKGASSDTNKNKSASSDNDVVHHAALAGTSNHQDTTTTTTTTTMLGNDAVNANQNSNGITSGFSFLASSVATSLDGPAADPLMADTDTEQSNPVISSSSAFSFISSPMDPVKTTTTTTNQEGHSESVLEVEEKGEGNEKEQNDLSRSNPMVSSGFSFLSGGIGGSSSGGGDGVVQNSGPNGTDTANAMDGNPTHVGTVPTAQNGDSQGQLTGQHHESIFSMLNLKVKSSSEPSTAKENSTMTQEILSLSKPVTMTSSSSSLSSSLPSSSSLSQPTGSGIVFGGAVKPKAVVKKRSRTKKIGAAVTSSVPGEEISPSDTATSGGGAAAPVSYGAQRKGVESESSPSVVVDAGQVIGEDAKSSLVQEANEIISRAEEFMSSKTSVSSSVPMSYNTGRYSSSGRNNPVAVVEEDYGDASYAGPSVEETDDYERAKAAAQEAMKKEAGISSSSSLRKIGFGGGISGFFKRNLTGGSVTVEKHVEKKQGLEIPSYGQSLSGSNSGTRENRNHDEDIHEDGGDYEEHDKEEEEDGEAQQMKDEMRRLEAIKQHQIQQEMERKASEEARLEQERRNEIERARKEEEKKRKEAEEATNRTPQRLLQYLLQEFATKSQSATLAVTNLRQERATMLEKRASVEKQSRLALQQISQAEKQQMEAAEQEDFELADRLAAVIEQHQREKEEFAQVLEQIEGLIEDLDYRRLDVVKRVWLCFMNVQKELQEFLSQQEHSEITDDAEIWRKFEDETRKLGAENERLMSYLKNIERDEGFAKEEREELEATIHEQTSGIEELRDSAKGKLDRINEEIEELRRLLEAKEMEAAKVKLELHDYEDSIEQVRNKFSRQLHRLEKKESAVRESRREWEAEELIYKKARENLEAQVTAHSEAIVAHDKIIAQVKDEIQIAEELAKIIAQEVMVEKGSDKDDIDRDLLKMQSEVLELEAATDEANAVLSAAFAIITNLTDEISHIDTKLPILESEKKTAASNRDFKAAAKASKEIKELTARRNKCSEELEGEASERHQTAKQVVEDCSQKLEQKKAVAHEKEKEMGVKRMIELVKKIINLEKIREEVCGTENEQLDSVKAVGGFVLDSEISALIMEGEELDKRFGGWTDIMLEYANKESDGEVIADSAPAATADGDVDNDDNPVNETEQTTSNDQENDDSVHDDGQTEYADNTNNENDEKISREETLMKFREMNAQLAALESKLEAAIDAEEYEIAAELDDEIAMIKDTIESLDLSDDEKNVAISGASPPDGTSGQDEDVQHDANEESAQDEKSIQESGDGVEDNINNVHDTQEERATTPLSQDSSPEEVVDVHDTCETVEEVHQEEKQEDAPHDDHAPHDKKREENLAETSDVEL